jgi:acetyl esterase/lipase
VPQLPRPVVEAVARGAIKPLLSSPLRVRRPLAEVLSVLNQLPTGVSIARQARAGIPGELALPDGVSGPPRVLYLHGGAYEALSPRTYRNIFATIAVRSGLQVFASDYRLAPEHPAPAALNDALAVYEAMTDDAGEPVAIAGDSAGGGLALALAVAARDRDLPPPHAIALISPWVDMTMSGRSVTENSGRDATLSRRAVLSGVRSYASELGPEHPICSPIRSDLTGLSPMLIHAGGNELFRSEGEELARLAEAAGVEVTLRVFEGLWHDFQTHVGMLAEADESLAEIGEFLSRAAP